MFNGSAIDYIPKKYLEHLLHSNVCNFLVPTLLCSLYLSSLIHWLSQSISNVFLIRFCNASAHTKKKKFNIRNYISKWEEIRKKLQIWSNLSKKSFMKNFTFNAVIMLRPTCIPTKVCFECSGMTLKKTFFQIKY